MEPSKADLPTSTAESEPQPLTLNARDIAREVQCSIEAARRILRKCGRKLPGIGWRCTRGELLHWYYKQAGAPPTPFEYRTTLGEAIDASTQRTLDWLITKGAIRIAILPPLRQNQEG
jgi:hypothetical protein